MRCEYHINPLGIDVTNPRLSWIIQSQHRSWKQNAYQIIVAAGEENLKQNKGDLWDTGRVESSQTIHIAYEGKPLKSSMHCYWKVRVWDSHDKLSAWSEPAWWEMTLLRAEDWTALWINDGKPTPKQDEDFYNDDPAPLFRKQFTATKPIKHALLYISGLGYYEAHINGRKVGDHVLDPALTTYSKRVFYSTYDVTNLLSEGQNTLGVMLGNGWYNPLPMHMWGWLNLREHLTIGRPRLIAQLNIEYTDGTHQSVVTDESWKVADGPILRNNIYLGEVYDARGEKQGWDKPDFDDHDWRRAKPACEPVGTLQAQPQPPIKVTATFKPVNLTEPKPGVYIIDMGQNFAGWVKFRVKGPAGTKVKLRYGELLYPDGTLNVMTSVCGQVKPEPNEAVPQAKPGYAGPGAPILGDQTDTYILNGEGEEVYTPHFTFHGFRYVEITGFPGTPTLDTLEGLRLNAAVEQAGSFSCSNEMFNHIQKMTEWTFLSNLFGVQSDCPARERFGYGGDIVASSAAFLFNFDMATFYAKVIQDFDDAQRPNGGITVIAPYNGVTIEGLGGDSGPIDWGTVHPLLQQQLYQYYGNQQLMEQQYETTWRWVEFLRSKSQADLIEIGLGDHESIDEKPVALTSAAFYYHNVQLMSQIAGILGRTKDADRYGRLARKIKKAFISKFLAPGTGKFYTNTQACQSFAFAMDLVPPKEQQAAIDVLLDQILANHKGHLSTGIFGTRYMLNALTQIGRADVAYTIVNQKTFPGWGYMLENGATTIWEHWAFSDNTFSHNHPMFGSVSEWFFSAIAGIQPHPEAVGFDRIIIKPEVVGDLTWAKAAYHSVRGLIKSDWSFEDGTFKLDVEIPANTTATVYIPAKNNQTVTESGRPASDSEGVQFLRMENGKAVFTVGSGQYRFVSRLSM